MTAPVLIASVEFNTDTDSSASLDIGTAANRFAEVIIQGEFVSGGVAEYDGSVTIGGLTMALHSVTNTTEAMNFERYTLAGAALNALTGSQSAAIAGAGVNRKVLVRVWSGVGQTTPNGDFDLYETVAVDTAITGTIDVSVDDLVVMVASNNNGGATYTWGNGLTQFFAGNVGGSPATWIGQASKAITAAATGEVFTATSTIAEAAKVGLVYAIKGVVANTAPVLAPIGAKTATAGSTLTISVSASDADLVPRVVDNLAPSSDFTKPNWELFTSGGATVTRPTMQGTIYGDSFTNDSGDIGAGLEAGVQSVFSLLRRGVGGNNSTQIRTVFDANFPDAGDTFVIIEGGINDIASAGADPNAILRANIAAMMTTALASGQDVILVGVGPWSNSGSWTEARQGYTDTYNAWAASTYPSNFVDVVAAIGDGDALAAEYDSGDGLHPNPAGFRAIDAAIIPVFPDIGDGSYTIDSPSGGRAFVHDTFTLDPGNYIATVDIRDSSGHFGTVRHITAVAGTATISTSATFSPTNNVDLRTYCTFTVSVSGTVSIRTGSGSNGPEEGVATYIRPMVQLLTVDEPEPGEWVPAGSPGSFLYANPNSASAGEITVGAIVPYLPITAAGLPTSATFTDNADGTGTFTWTPQAGDATGSPYAVTFTAQDSAGATDSEVVPITVSAAVATGRPGLIFSDDDSFTLGGAPQQVAGLNFLE